MGQLYDRLKKSGLPFAELINEDDHVHVAWKPAAASQRNAVPSGTAWQRMLQAESSTGQFKDGNVVISPAGAVGAAQVLPSTAKEAAQKAGIPWDENRFYNDEQYNVRIGRAYFDQLLKEFGGDTTKAVAAYNAGPGNVRQAVRQGGDAWASKLPAEAKNYLAKVISTGGGAVAGRVDGSAPGGVVGGTLEEAKAALDALLPAGMSARSREGFMARLEGRWNRREVMQKEAVATAEKQAVDAAVEWLHDNKGDFERMPASIRSTVPDDKVPYLMSYAEAVAPEAPKRETDEKEYLWLTSLATPQLKAMSRAEILAHQRNLSESDGRRLMDAWAEAQTAQPKNPDFTNYSRDKVNGSINNRLAEFGIDPNPKQRDQINAIAGLRRYLYNLVEEVQRNEKRQLTEKEIADLTDSAITRTVTYDNNGWLGGKQTKDVGEITYADIPKAIRNQIEAELKKRYGGFSEADVIAAFYGYVDGVQRSRRRRGR